MTRSPRPITPRQQQVLDFLVDYQRDNGFAPSLRDICRHFGWISSCTAQDHVRTLVNKGFVRTAGGKARAIVVLPAKKVANG